MMGTRGRVRAVTGRTRIALDRGWEAAATPAGALAEPRELPGARLRWRAARVPGTANALRRDEGAGDGRDALASDWWWHVRLDEPVTGTLGFDGVAGMWDAWLDGEWVAHGDSLHETRAIAVDVPARELVLRCRAGAGRRVEPAVLGPWRPVWWQPRGVPDVGLVSIDARLEAGVGFVLVGAQLPAGTDRATLIVERGGARVTAELAEAAGAWTGCAAVLEPARWWPHGLGEPARYAVRLELGGGAVVDLGATGFRTIELEPGAGLRVHGEPVAGRGELWAPADPATLAAPVGSHDDAVRALAAAGVGVLRVPATTCYADDELLDALDAHGVLLWQDLMFPTRAYPTDPAAIAAAITEAEHELARLAARPALAVVCGSGAPAAAGPHVLFDELLADRARAIVSGVPYVASAAGWDAVTGGAR